MPQIFLLLVLGLSLACNREKPGNASASAYTSDADSSAREDGFAGTNSGSELEAPRLIPAIQNQLTLMASGTQPPNPDNYTAYRNMAGDLVNAMIADLNRAGNSDVGSFRSLADSTLNDFGGGAAGLAKPDRSQLPQHVDRMQRLIRQYQQSMRAAAESR